MGEGTVVSDDEDEIEEEEDGRGEEKEGVDLDEREDDEEEDEEEEGQDEYEKDGFIVDDVEEEDDGEEDERKEDSDEERHKKKKKKRRETEKNYELDEDDYELLQDNNITGIRRPQPDSPIFGYVSSLSPIKPVNARPIVQVYENIDVPSPQLVFKTPNFSRLRNSTFSERSQHLASARTENLSPGYANNTREFPENIDIIRASLSLPMAHLVSYGDKECTSGDPSPNQSCTSPSKYIDAFLADPLENGDNSSSSPEFCVKRAAKDIEGDNTSHSDNQMESLKEDPLRVHPRISAISIDEQADDSLCSKKDAYPPHTSKNDSNNTEESTIELHAANMEKYTSRSMSLRSPYQTEEDPGSSSLATETMEIEEGSITRHENNSVHEHVMGHSLVSRDKDCDISHNEKGNCTTSDVLCHDEQDLTLQSAKSGQSDELDRTPQLHPGSPQDILTGDNHIDNSVPMPSASTGNHISYNPEDGAQHQRGKRKRLQFEAAENLKISNINSFNYTTETSYVDLPITPLEVEKVNASSTESITVSSHKQMIQSIPEDAPCRISIKVNRSRQYKESLVTAPRPAGIGLHLNSIGSAASMNCNSNIKLAERNSSVQEEKALAEDIDPVSDKSKNCPTSMNLIDATKLTFSSEKPLYYAVNENKEEKQQGYHPFQQHSSVSYQSPLSVKPLNNSVPKRMDRSMTPCIIKSLSSEEANRSEESTQTSPRKKRKKAPENDGHKRCNCKRSKCLKLYCDCFAAGSFCSEACACQECSNRLEHEETVRQTRQQIESRNPLAFAPKVVLRISDPPKASGDKKPVTPTSARHKRGCNCKKSLCLKKYCECFQASVGCSLGCRCDGCKNTFGTKDGFEISEAVVEHRRPKEGGWERDLSGELEGIEVKRQIANTKQCHSRLSPLTPSLQSSMGNDVPKQFPSSYFPSPESVASVMRSYESSGADLDAMQNVGLAEDRTESLSLVPYDPENEYLNPGKVNAGKVDPFSPGWEGFPDLCNLSPWLKASGAGGSSSASKTGERKILQMKLFQGNTRISLGSLCWHSSPMTPVPQFGESKFLREPDSESGLHCNPEDDTPEILKETQSPIKSVKATSPNQKRVSPPHQVMCGTGANSPSDLRGLRKIILQSVPAFPSLTPLSKSNREDGT